MLFLALFTTLAINTLRSRHQRQKNSNQCLGSWRQSGTSEVGKVMSWQFETRPWHLYTHFGGNIFCFGGKVLKSAGIRVPAWIRRPSPPPQITVKNRSPKAGSEKFNINSLFPLRQRGSAARLKKARNEVNLRELSTSRGFLYTTPSTLDFPLSNVNNRIAIRLMLKRWMDFIYFSGILCAQSIIAFLV